MVSSSPSSVCHISTCSLSLPLISQSSSHFHTYLNLSHGEHFYCVCGDTRRKLNICCAYPSVGRWPSQKRDKERAKSHMFMNPQTPEKDEASLVLLGNHKARQRDRGIRNKFFESRVSFIRSYIRKSGQKRPPVQDGRTRSILVPVLCSSQITTRVS